MAGHVASFRFALDAGPAAGSAHSPGVVAQTPLACSPTSVRSRGRRTAHGATVVTRNTREPTWRGVAHPDLQRAHRGFDARALSELIRARNVDLVALQGVRPRSGWIFRPDGARSKPESSPSCPDFQSRQGLPSWTNIRPMSGPASAQSSPLCRRHSTGQPYLPFGSICQAPAMVCSTSWTANRHKPHKIDLLITQTENTHCVPKRAQRPFRSTAILSSWPATSTCPWKAASTRYWSDKVRASILIDSSADILIYGMKSHCLRFYQSSKKERT